MARRLRSTRAAIEALRTLALCAGPAALLAWTWLRLGRPHAGGATALWLIVLATVPALLPRPRWRLVALAGTSVLGLHAALGVWIVHPLRLLDRFGSGFLEFYDVKLPFAAHTHPRMEDVILVGLFASCALVALLVSARRPVPAAIGLLVAAGWPATLLIGPDDLSRGVVLLAALLSLLVGVGGEPRPRRIALAAVAGAGVVLAAFAASTSSAVASGQVLRWQGWDFYTKPQKPVDVEYVWHSDYRGIKFPKKATVVLRIKAPSQPTYWRATALDEYDGGNWYESPTSVGVERGGGRDVLVEDDQFPAAARDSGKWVRQEVEVGALRDNHLVGASVPVAYSFPTATPDYAAGGIAYLQDNPLERGDRYEVWSYEAQPTPRQLARVEPRYPKEIAAVDLAVAPHIPSVPSFGRADREQRIRTLFARSYIAREYKDFYALARRIVGVAPPNPYAAALELEGWFRSGAFRYDEHPPPVGTAPPLVEFALHTRRGYCQHFAGAMALMLRYLGIPARVAAGFTSGTYDRSAHEWTVTDHDAHTWVEAWFPRYGWLPFDPTPGRGALNASYTASSPHFDLADGLFAVASKVKRPGAFDLRKLRVPAAHGGQAAKRQGAPAERREAGGRIGSLLELLALVAAVLVALVVGVKLLLRKRRYLTRDPRRLAAACVRELADYVADQGARAPPSATVHELGRLVEDELGVSARAFVAAAAQARFGPASGARAAAGLARRELRALRRELRNALTRSERAVGLVSLRSLGLTG